TRAFIAYAHWQVRSFGSATRDDGLSRQLNVAIREIETASNRLLRALKYLETREGKELISYNFHTLTHRDPKIKWSESQFISYLANVHQTTLKRAIKNDWLFANAPLDDFKRRLEALK